MAPLLLGAVSRAVLLTNVSYTQGRDGLGRTKDRGRVDPNLENSTMTTYKIVRHHFSRPNRTMKTGLTLEEAQEHCSDPETSSTTAKDGPPGQWFDGYTEE